MIIRKALPKDFKELKQLKSEFFLWECSMDKRMHPEYIKRNLGIRLAKNLRQTNTIFFIAIDNKKKNENKNVKNMNQIIGYVGAEIQNNPSFVKSEKRGHLFNLYVRPNHQKKGIGTKLVKEVLEWFKENNVDDLMIMAYSENKIARRIYNKIGFKDYIIEMNK